MKITIFAGDIADAPAEAICTSTNPRLSLMMGTGAAVRDRGGYEILRACEAILAASGRATLPAGSVHVTTAGSLHCKRVIHCVASDTSHRSSDDVVRSCVRNALLAADSERCATIAMPVFGTGHARLNFEHALRIIAAAIAETQTTVEHAYVVVRNVEFAEKARKVFPGAEIFNGVTEEEPSGMWSAE